MNALISAAFDRARVVVMSFVMILAAGVLAYTGIPKESTPEVPIPTVLVSTSLEGISPKDSERLLVKPLEAELGALTSLKSMTATADEGLAMIQLEFEPGFDSKAALDKVRDAVDRAENDLPTDATSPVVTEINTALFPILTIVLSGPVPERSLGALADDARDRIEGLAGVLEVEVVGKRTEIMEVLVDPLALETYDLSFQDLISQVTRNNRLIAAGTIEGRAGRITLKVPGLIENVDDVMDLPVKVQGNTVVSFGEVATLRRSFEDPASFARIDGQPALALEVKKRPGANIIETIEAVRQELDSLGAEWPEGITVHTLHDKSEQVKTMLSDLESNVIAAVLLVMIVIIWALGPRAAVLVGLAIPGAFLCGIAVLQMMGLTMNMVVLFSLILVVGMLVDGAIVTVELADRYLQDGDNPSHAYAQAARRMAWPVIAGTATTLCVFLPLLFWEGVVGQFMIFLPITVILTLGASLAMALVFIPVLGGMIGRRQPVDARAKEQIRAAETGDPRQMHGFGGRYARLLEKAVLRPRQTLFLAVLALVATFAAYGQFGKGVSFFPSVEPDFAQVDVRARDNLSIFEQDRLIREVEDRLLEYTEIASVYARTGAGARSDAEIIGRIQLEFTPWDSREPAETIMERIRAEMRDIPGIEVQVQAQSNGPGGGKPVEIRVTGQTLAIQAEAVKRIREELTRIGGFADISDSRPLPGVEWALSVDRSEAARQGADITLVGQAVQMLTHGITLADYRPEEVDGAIDIRLRFPPQDRTLSRLEALRIPTAAGLVPISNFVAFHPVPRSGAITRIDEVRVTTISSDVAPGVLVDDQIAALRTALEAADFPDGVAWDFAGEAEDQREAMTFLLGAFGAAIGLMVLILVVQFNSFSQALVVMSAIVFSVAGVLLGLLVTGRPFGVVMGGIGVIALAGIVVNNNIVLIDAFNGFRQSGMAAREAALRAGAQRLRPVLLTSATTALGLLPMVIGINIDFAQRKIIYGAPSTQWWIELSTAIAGGLTLATLLTLVVTPAMLVLGQRRERNSDGAPPEHPDIPT